jgi:hypothetical protein
LKSIRNRCLFDKPNVGELAKLIGVEKLEMEEVNAAAKKNHCKGWSRNCGCFSSLKVLY